MFSVEIRGDFKKTESFFQRMLKGDIYRQVEGFAQAGVAALAAATPVDSGLTSQSWDYKIVKTPINLTIIFTNSNVVDGRPIAVLLQYGHGTGTGGWVEGLDYINPAMRPIFNKIADNVWKAVKSA